MQVLVPKVVADLDESGDLGREVLYLTASYEELLLVESGLLLEVVESHLKGFVVEVVHGGYVVDRAILFDEGFHHVYVL